MSASDIFILSLFDMVIMILLAGSFSKKDNYRIVRTGLFIIVGASLIALAGLLSSSGLMVHLYSTVVIFIWLYLYLGRGDIQEKFILYILSLTGLYLFQIVSVIIVQGVLPGFERILLYGMISQAVSLLFAILVYRYAGLGRLQSLINSKSSVFRAIVLNLYLVYFFLTVLWYMEVEYITESGIQISIMVLLSLLINMFFFRAGLINEVNKERLNVLETYLPIIDDVMDEIKKKQHDYHNHVQTIMEIKNNPAYFDTKDVDSYIESLTEVDIWDSLLRLDNKVVMAFFYSKIMKARSLGIDVEMEINCPLRSTNLSDYELVEVYGILLDNAIESSVTANTKQIKVKVKSSSAGYSVTIANSVQDFKSSDIKKLFSYGYSTKGKEGRGIGLYKVNQMMKKENGTIAVNYDTTNEQLNITIDHNQDV